MIRRAVLLLGLTLTLACRIERHPPAPTRYEDAVLRSVVIHFYEAQSRGDTARLRSILAPNAFVDSMGADQMRREVRVLRTDFPQFGDLASIWVVAGAGGRDSVLQNVLLERSGDQWFVRQVVTSPR